MGVEHNFLVLITLGSVQQSIWVFQYAAHIVLLLRLWKLGLATTYRFFFAYLAVATVRTSGLFFLAPCTDAYGWAYVLTVPVLGVLCVLVVLELYGLVLRNHAGIVTLGRWVVSGGLILAFTVASLSLYPDLSNPTEEYPILLYFNVFQRALDSALLIFLTLITAFLVWFPVPLSRNTVLHTIVFGVFFSSNALLLLIRNVVGAEPTRILSTISLGAESLCLLAWILFLNRKGEESRVVFGHRWRPEDSGRLVEQLNAVNSTLLRSARK